MTNNKHPNPSIEKITLLIEEAINKTCDYENVLLQYSNHTDLSKTIDKLKEAKFWLLYDSTF